MTAPDLLPKMEPHVAGWAFSFEPGVLYVSKDGSGYIAVNEGQFQLEDDRDGEGGSVHWIARLPVGEPVELRDFLNGLFPQTDRAIPTDAVRALVEALRRHHKWHNEIGLVLFTPEEGSDGPTEINLSTEYGDSSLCEITLDALAHPAIKAMEAPDAS